MDVNDPEPGEQQQHQQNGQQQDQHTSSRWEHYTPSLQLDNLSKLYPLKPKDNASPLTGPSEQLIMILLHSNVEEWFFFLSALLQDLKTPQQRAESLQFFQQLVKTLNTTSIEFGNGVNFNEIVDTTSNPPITLLFAALNRCHEIFSVLLSHHATNLFIHPVECNADFFASSVQVLPLNKFVTFHEKYQAQYLEKYQIPFQLENAPKTLQRISMNVLTNPCYHNTNYLLSKYPTLVDGVKALFGQYRLQLETSPNNTSIYVLYTLNTVYNIQFGPGIVSTKDQVEFLLLHQPPQSDIVKWFFAWLGNGQNSMSPAFHALLRTTPTSFMNNLTNFDPLGSFPTELSIQDLINLIKYTTTLIDVDSMNILLHICPSLLIGINELIEFDHVFNGSLRKFTFTILDLAILKCQVPLAKWLVLHGARLTNDYNTIMTMFYFIQAPDMFYHDGSDTWCNPRLVDYYDEELNPNPNPHSHDERNNAGIVFYLELLNQYGSERNVSGLFTHLKHAVNKNSSPLVIQQPLSPAWTPLLPLQPRFGGEGSTDSPYIQQLVRYGADPLVFVPRTPDLQGINIIQFYASASRFLDDSKGANTLFDICEGLSWMLLDGIQYDWFT